MDILNKLETPELVVVNIGKERSEHFGQIRYDISGELALENNEIKDLVIEDVDPSSLPFILDIFLNESRQIRDEPQIFSMNIIPELHGITFNGAVNKLFIIYSWKEA